MFTDIKFEEVKAVVDEINDTIFEINEDEETAYCVLHYYNGDFWIYFLEDQIWNSSEDEREYSDEDDDFAMSIRDYVVNEVCNILEKYSKIKLRGILEDDS
jgi:hypothetical protein